MFDIYSRKDTESSFTEPRRRSFTDMIDELNEKLKDPKYNPLYTPPADKDKPKHDD